MAIDIEHWEILLLTSKRSSISEKFNKQQMLLWSQIDIHCIFCLPYFFIKVSFFFVTFIMICVVFLLMFFVSFLIIFIFELCSLFCCVFWIKIIVLRQLFGLFLINFGNLSIKWLFILVYYQNESQNIVWLYVFVKAILILHEFFLCINSAIAL